MSDERWLRTAMLDDTLVADLLLRLSVPNDSADGPSPSALSFLMTPLPRSWGARQPRSKPPPSTSSSVSAEKKREPRRSPTTPLSWTGGAEPSDGGCEESSSLNFLPPPPPPSSSSDRFRSKVSAASDTPTTSSKRSKRKKTFTELKEEECSLLKEQTYLKKELATLHLTLKEQRSINENLKRIKLDLQVESGMNPEPNPHLEEQNTNLLRTCGAASSSATTQVKTEGDVSQCPIPAQKGVSSQEPVFVLPDLNMAPDQESSLAWMS
ncbi:hypothetical protein vseg_006733 [Gypsophila vaccaria]